jgi:hypothetical protein
VVFPTTTGTYPAGAWSGTGTFAGTTTSVSVLADMKVFFDIKFSFIGRRGGAILVAMIMRVLWVLLLHFFSRAISTVLETNYSDIVLRGPNHLSIPRLHHLIDMVLYYLMDVVLSYDTDFTVLVILLSLTNSTMSASKII